MLEMLFSVREKLKKGEVVTGADVEEIEDVEQTTASGDHMQSGWTICEKSLRKSLQATNCLSDRPHVPEGSVN